MPTIGKYEILEQLGSGSMGTVYKGRDTLLDRMVAIKTIRTGVNVELEAKERFYREARTCARLNHPHIVAVYDLGEENGTSFIAMELLDGSDFRQLIERREKLPLSTKLTAMAQICEALAYAHRAGVIHRDIKPSNLFLPSDCRAKVVDFGIAKLPTSHLTRAGAILGTPNYMAPEQINGVQCDGRADLFSAAVVFFEFLTFRHPFKSNLIPRRIMEDKPDSLLEQDPTLPAILEKIFTKALAKNPNDRYATGDDFAADLRSVNEALTNNSSPTFSRVELPSQHSLAVPPPIPNTESMNLPDPLALGNGIGKGADGAEPEWRVNRMLKLIPTFEGHISARDVQASRNSLTEMESVAGDDPRYKQPVESCRLKLVQLENAPTVETVAKVRCAKCANINRADATFCVGCGAPLGPATGMGSSGIMTRPLAGPFTNAPPVSTQAPIAATGTTTASASNPRTVPKTQSVPVAAPIAYPVSPKPPPPPKQVVKPTGTGMAKSDRVKLFAVIGFVALAAVLLLVAPMFFRTIKPETSIGTAVVASKQGRVLNVANDSGKVVATLDRGAAVNILQLPTSLNQGWTRVQGHSGTKFSEPGFLKTADLRDWDSKDPNTALTLARMSGPMDAGTDAEIRAQSDRLKAVAASFAGQPAAGLANLDAAKLEFALAKRAKDANPGGTEWQASLAELTIRLQNMRTDAALQSESDELLRQIRDAIPATELAQQGVPSVESSAPPAPSAVPLAGSVLPAQNSSIPTQPSVPLTDAEVKRYLAAAQQALSESRYTDALAQVGRILKSQPQNSDAKALRKKINDQIEFERSLK